ncbi:hypothetical protein SAMN02745194_04333 [Roseomonas rosea]|uniref:Uncharacterized protein n=1 Tax=Muricoccus roseus TaxID=198092 RepID=A0A1M6Q8V5_9PROT|nr:hypothetical protein [Roseomonas rosea]SHK16586.1 hypothetical protein SAMN02745194_04333 [Roseomonas rosea]
MSNGQSLEISGYSTLLTTAAIWDRRLSKEEKAQLVIRAHRKMVDRGAAAPVAMHDLMREAEERSYLDLRRPQHVRPDTTLYKKMKREHLDRFFADGEMLISTLSVYRSIEKAPIEDGAEGQFLAIAEGASRTFMLEATTGAHAFIYCMTNDPNSAFDGYDATLVIKDNRGFMNALHTALRDQLRNEHGISIDKVMLRRCHYQFTRAVIGDLNPAAFRHPDNPGKISLWSRSAELVHNGQFVIKHKKYEQDSEYRIIFICNAEPPPRLLICCPEARRFCSVST